MRRAPAAAVAALATALTALSLSLSACGGIIAPDLFVVARVGPAHGQQLTLLVNEEGAVHCNGISAPKLSDAQLVQARAIQEDLKEPASKHLVLAPAPGSVTTYYVRDEAGTVRFADNSHGQPPVLRRLALFVLQTAQQVCHLPQ
ncbi:MAG TPA: hypothetical protein VHY83_09320 [Solirubrobacteraceae bacterium]|jgi:hypothetical protein|nr:hypothetical protein [Solirubrobacteraceae bacterium]